jgi:glycosyltransferase involved in cell wall biosynthesis
MDVAADRAFRQQQGACLTMSTSRRFFIQASNVHQGGGAILLRALLEVRVDVASVHVQVDERMHLSHTPRPDVVVRKVRASLLRRLLAERWLAQNTDQSDLVLCFGNLPPLFRTAGRVIVLIQNRYLIDDVSLKAFPLKSRLRLQIERWWLSAKAENADAFVVQTPSMEAILQGSGKAQGKPVYVFPFVSVSDGYQRSLTLSQAGLGVNSTFLYVGSGEPHKNHRSLIEAWCLLAQEGRFPALWLTLDGHSNVDLCAWIDQKKQDFGLNLQNFGVQSHGQIKQLYTQVRALIFPSTFESFGLPLIEARQAGLAILASELDFVRDVLDPEQVFDPQSPVSIARAVKRFMGASEEALPLLNAAEFMKSLLEKCE